jgi:hypothetical protein
MNGYCDYKVWVFFIQTYVKICFICYRCSKLTSQMVMETLLSNDPIEHIT